jgi:hypothetical protein
MVHRASGDAPSGFVNDTESALQGPTTFYGFPIITSPGVAGTLEGRHEMLGRSRFTLRSVLLIIAVILFVVAAIGYDVKGISLIALGLAFAFASFLVP